MGNVSFSALGRVEELGARLRCGLDAVEGQIGERLFMEQGTFICQSLLDMVLINHSYFHRRIAKIFFQCAFTLRAPLDARLFPVLLKPAGNTDRNADTVLASFSKIVKQTACNGKAFFPSLWEATGTANDCAEGDGTSNKYGDRPLFTA
ncbi:hypothetical protein, unlikely [Trypanosoma congolense IL3000]|uniref:Uncharacterized protein n=1 Tax=Trypanosoma congolense (strain IL3000) TaxID=1068625 RepID=F9WBD1_TRYCI|nr:hypothetical protein, unlikely [Trypanosoma congolense IL3000]